MQPTQMAGDAAVAPTPVLNAQQLVEHAAAAASARDMAVSSPLPMQGSGSSGLQQPAPKRVQTQAGTGPRTPGQHAPYCSPPWGGGTVGTGRDFHDEHGDPYMANNTASNC